MQTVAFGSHLIYVFKAFYLAYQGLKAFKLREAEARVVTHEQHEGQYHKLQAYEVKGKVLYDEAVHGNKGAYGNKERAAALL